MAKNTNLDAKVFIDYKILRIAFLEKMQNIRIIICRMLNMMPSTRLFISVILNEFHK
jgi:hypothetical protein